MTDKAVKVSQDIIDMARAAKRFCTAAAEDDAPLPSDELFVRAAVAFSMLMRMGDAFPVMPEMAVTTIAMNFADAAQALGLAAHDEQQHHPSTPERAALFATVLPDDYGQALQEAVAGNRRVLGLPPQGPT